MSAANGNNPPLPYLSSAEPGDVVPSHNAWGLLVEEVPVFSEPQRFINVPAQAGIVRSPFREGVMRCDEHGIHFSGRQNTPIRWLSGVGGVARVILFIASVSNSITRVSVGRKGLVSVMLGIIILASLLITVFANFINGRFREDVTFSVNWDAVRGLQLDKKLRFLTLLYEVPTPDGTGSVQHHLTLTRLQPATVAAVADIIERFAPLVYQNRYAAQERHSTQQRTMLLVSLAALVIAGGALYAFASGLIFP
jgi:hypothetical protein